MSGRVSSLWALCGAGKPQGAYLEDAVVTLLDLAACGRRGSALGRGLSSVAGGGDIPFELTWLAYLSISDWVTWSLKTTMYSMQHNVW